MRNRRASRLAAAALVAAIFLLACGDDDNPLTHGDGASTLTVLLVNADSEAVHLLRPGETFAASNRVEPDGHRQVDVGVTAQDGATFRAGRSGVVLAEVTCYTDEPAPLRGDVPRVTWNGFGLSCAAWDP